MLGKMRRGRDLTRKAWEVIRTNPALVRLPLLGGSLAVVAGLALVLPGVVLVSEDDPAVQIAGGVLIAVGTYLAWFLVTYFDVALARAADDALAGRSPDTAAARAAARSRGRTIAVWAVVSVVASVLGARLRSRGGMAGDLAAAIGETAWSVVTFLVVPVVALDDVRPLGAVKRSSSLVRGRWGEQASGNLVIGGIAYAVALAGGVATVTGVVMLSVGSVPVVVAGAVLALTGWLVVVASLVVASAAKGVFGVALYRFIADGRGSDAFAPDELQGAVRARMVP
jgi:hypothetical protein